MFSFFSHTKEGKKSIILDIQSGLVRGALVIENENGPDIIKSVVTKSIPNQTRILNGVHLTKRILKLTSDVVSLLSKDSAGKHISKVHYILSSPWIASQLKTIKADYKKETEINSHTLAELIKTELKHQTTEDMVPIEQKIFEVKLNGYPTTTFEAKRAHMLELSLATSFSPGQFLDKLHSAVNGVLASHEATHNSALLMQYAALREILADKHEYMYIHIHSELTDIVIVKGGLCRHIASFPFGISTFLRKITNSTKQSMESSDSLLSLFQGNKLSEQEKASTQQIIEPLLHEWNEACLKSFSSSFDSSIIPRTVYLAAHSHFDLFKEAITLHNDLNLSVVPYENITIDDGVTFEKSSAQSTMMKMYTLALRTVL